MKVNALVLFWCLSSNDHATSLFILPELSKPVPQVSSDRRSICASFVVDCATVLGLVLLAPAPCHAADKEWNLPNGHVKLSNAFVVTRSSNQRPVNPRLIGSGGGGAVFAFDAAGEPSARTHAGPPIPSSSTLIKVSWVDSTPSVKQECSILQYLNEQKVSGVENCLDLESYPDDPTRVIMVKEPYIPDTVGSIADLDSPQDQIKATKQVARTLVQMLAANVATVDVQPLISENGDVLFIDMTEAKILERPVWSSLDAALSRSFVSEMLALIPKQFQIVAEEAIREELSRLGEEVGEGTSRLSDESLKSLRTFLYPFLL